MVLQSIVNGLIIGSCYALIAMGLNCVYSVMKIINFCQQDFMMVGMYIAYFAFTLLGIDPFITAILVAVIMFLFGIVFQKTLVTPMLNRNADHHTMILLTFGFGLLLQNLAQLFFTADYRTIKTPLSSSMLKFGGVVVSKAKLLTFIIIVLIAIALAIFYKKTKMGKMLRATSQNQYGAQVIGIKTDRVYYMTFGIGTALAGAGGALLLSFYYVYPSVGNMFGTTAFAVIMLGGLGNIFGAFIAGLGIGVLENISSLILGTSAFKTAIICFMFLSVLIIRHAVQERKSR